MSKKHIPKYSPEVRERAVQHPARAATVVRWPTDIRDLISLAAVRIASATHTPNLVRRSVK